MYDAHFSLFQNNDQKKGKKAYSGAVVIFRYRSKAKGLIIKKYGKKFIDLLI